MVACFGLTVLGAGTASADKCLSAKLKAIAKEEGGLLQCSSKEATKGVAAVEPACTAKVRDKFAKAYAKVVGCSTPPAAQCESIADHCQAELRAALPDGDGTNPSKCEAARLKAAGKKAKAKLACYAKVAKNNLPVDHACLAKAEAKFTTAYNKVSGCATDGPTGAANTESLIDNACVDAVVTVDGTGRVTGICATTTSTTTTTTTSTSTTSTTAVMIPTCDAPQACHDPCAVGAPQCQSCSPCVAAVCDQSQDPSCCDPMGDGWTSLCASMVELVCQMSCN
jgi:hypothetical protein